jgi:hypothetical protein
VPYWPADDTPKSSKNFITAGRRNFWSFQPLKRPEVPKVKDASWPINNIDKFVLALLEKDDLKPAPPADRRTLLRRVTYDLTGLPPTYEEVQAFEADKSPNAYEKVVDRLLASPHYGEMWARHWMDLVRYGEDDYPRRPGAGPRRALSQRLRIPRLAGEIDERRYALRHVRQGSAGRRSDG